MKTISAIIIVKNNPTHLFETLNSIENLASEIIIGNIDIGNDYLKKLKENKKIKVIDLPSTIPFADMVKEDLKKNSKGEYILFLDPDEIFPTISPSSLDNLLTEYDAIYFPRKNMIFNKWIRYSRWWPDYQLRLFKKNSVIWPKEIHPIPQTKGKEFKLASEEKNAILHYNYDNLDQYLEKSIRYAKTEANIRKNYSFSEASKLGISEFISRYFANDGYKDGMHGLILALLQMFYYFLVYFYYWEKKKYGELENNPGSKLENFTGQLNFETGFWLIKKNLVSNSEKIRYKIRNKISKLLR